MTIGKPARASLVVVFVLLVVGGWLLSQDPAAPIAFQQPETADTRLPETGDISPETLPTIGQSGRFDARVPDRDASGPEDQAPCLRISDLELALDVNNEVQRLRTIVPTGQWFNDYRAIAPEGLASLADQGDTAAMVVLGARAELAAIGEDPARALEKLNGESPLLGVASRLFDEAQPAARREQLEVAREWYERAAVLGHLGALHHLGNVQVALGETPVTLGWISEEDFEGLPEPARFPTEVINAYTVAIGEIAPNARTGISGVLLEIAGPALHHKPYAQAIAMQYAAARRDAGLSPVDVAAGISTDDIRELAQDLCPEDLALLEAN